uniref:Peptidase S1 domain-containing protein n=1 Tax=Cacopsylla melanoneura TaxID=428564 RepID=A0A8D8TED9_9HEMI
MIKPLIYYRTNNDTNDTSNTTDNTASTMPGDNQQPDINIVFNTEDPTLANLKDKGKEEAFLCVTKCPHTVLSIEMYIEGNRRICTGVLLEDDFVMTSGSCIPADWRPWFVTHPGRIFVRPLDDIYTIETKKFHRTHVYDRARLRLLLLSTTIHRC